jgi:TusA-related sulfurtransferase
MTDQKPDVSLDLRGVACPMNWVRARLTLDELSSGQLLEITTDDGESTLSITKNLRGEGHQILEITPLENAFRLIVKVGDES